MADPRRDSQITPPALMQAELRQKARLFVEILRKKANFSEVCTNKGAERFDRSHEARGPTKRKKKL